MKRHRVATSEDLPRGAFGADGHDLRDGLKRLRLSLSLVVSARTEQKCPQVVPTNQLHVAHRYGVRLTEADAERTRRDLQGIIVWLEGELG